MRSIYETFQQHFRPGRLRLFYSSFQVTRRTRVLDLGGSVYFWELAKNENLPVPQVTVLNIHPGPSGLPSQINWLVGDARETSLKNLSFDIVFSNSLIEHLGNLESQTKCANEVRRLAPSYFIQTPSKWFFMEPHFLTPFTHWLPNPVRRRLGPRATLWGWRTRATRPEYEARLEEIRLLDIGEMRELFPDARVVGERWMGTVKSIVAIRGGH